MSNNPLEAVTQAVNSLVTALKLPDESAKANEVLGEMSFPQFSRLLPYRDYNQESGLFMNDTTMGFMLEAIPINGANKSIVEALDHMLRTKLPRGIPLCIHLMSSQLVGDRIEYGLREFSWSGEQAERFNAITRVLSDNESKVFFEKVKGQYPEMDIKIPFLTVMETLQYKPAESAAKVQCPVLIVIAGQDSVNPPEQGKALYDAVASGTKELYEEADACHYDIYEGAFFERVAAVQTQWFKKHL
ncbi:TraC family protein [Escherichia coli]|nr:TraC family protein [Escherichia coli]